MRQSIPKLLLTALTALVLSSQAVADVTVGIAFSQGEVEIIAQWYQGHGGHSVQGNGNGKHKPKGLPPGIAKNLDRGKPLPPGISKQVLPQGLIALLPPPRHGFERIIVDGKVLLVEVATRVIHDILVDAILH